MFVHFLLSQQEGASHVFDQATVTFVFLCLAVDVPPTPTALLTAAGNGVIIVRSMVRMRS